MNTNHEWEAEASLRCKFLTRNNPFYGISVGQPRREGDMLVSSELLWGPLSRTEALQAQNEEWNEAAVESIVGGTATSLIAYYTLKTNAITVVGTAVIGGVLTTLTSPPNHYSLGDIAILYQFTNGGSDSSYILYQHLGSDGSIVFQQLINITSGRN